jgi:Zn-dependent protease with chaperone function
VRAWHLLTQIVGHHLIPCLFASALMHAVMQALSSSGLVRRASHRALFRYAGLVKAALALWVGESVSFLSSDPRLLGYFGFRLPNLVPNDPRYDPRKLAAVLASSELTSWVLSVILISAGALLVYRWVRLAPVYRGIYARLGADRDEYPEVFRVFDELAGLMHGPGTRLPRPRLLLVRGVPCSAFTMGVRPPIVVLSAELAAQLRDDELRGVLAHELAHVCRLDYLGRWAAGILRDIMIWNPFALFWFERLKDEQEQACDQRAAEVLGDPAAVASGLVEVAAHGAGLPVITVGPLYAWQAHRHLNELHRRLDYLASSASAEPDTRRILSLTPCLTFLAFALAQPHVAFSMPDMVRLVAGSY